MDEIILATNNQHKAAEFTAIFGRGIRFNTLRQIDFNDPIIENGQSFIENSLIKCRTVYQKTNKPVMADDSGLCVDALEGRPGILSARYGGEGLNDQERYEKLLTELKGLENLKAAFVCALVLFINPNKIYIIQEETSGLITFNPRGNNGFGYDPIFFLPQYNKTMAELSDTEKNLISHRGKAAELIKKILMA